MPDVSCTVSDEELVWLSHRLSRILRHDPRSVGLELDRFGWTDIDELCNRSGIPRDIIHILVERNSRYEVSDDGTRIRACHGHSVDVEYDNNVTPPDVLYHGTGAVGYTGICESGSILPMRRAMVHLSSSVERAREIGSKRKGDLVIIRVDARSMSDDGYEFYLTADDVYLVSEVPSRYMEKMESS